MADLASIAARIAMFVNRTATFCSSSTRRGLHLVALNNGRGYESRRRPPIMRIPTQHIDGICNTNVQMMNNSSLFSSMPSYDTSSTSFVSNKSFKKVIRPFLRACHPDAMSSSQVNDADSRSRRKQHPLSQQAKDTNLKAVQTLNGLIDVLDDLISRCTPPSYQQQQNHDTTKKSAASLPELNSRYEIEFILPPTTTTNTADDNDRPIKRKHRDKLALTLRSITISFPDSLRSNVRQYALSTYHEEEAYQVAQQLKVHAMSELLRLLTIAGMSVPVDVVNEQQGRDHRRGDQRKQKGQWTLSDHFLHELGIVPSTEDVQETPSQAFFGRTQSRPTSPHLRQSQSTAPPPTYSHPQLQQQREAFMKSFQKVSHKFENDYDQAFLDAQADHTTTRLNLYNENTVEGRERREQLVSTICGGVRIWRAKIDDKDTDTANQDLEDEVPEGLDVVAQLIAIRRLSLILYDNFDYLKMEKMGRMYEQLTIVLTPPQNNLTSRRKPQKMLREDGTRIHPGRKLNKWERNKKKRDRLQNLGSRSRMRYIAEKYLGKKNDDDSTEEEGDEEEKKPSYQFESGFRFSYGTQSDQGIGKVTAYIPVDFRDGELVRQMYTHLYDYFDNCCGKVGWLSYGADGNIKANMEEDDTYTSGMRHESSN